MIVITTYYIWACRGFFGYGILSTTLRASLAMVLFTVLFIAGVAAAMVVTGAGMTP
jgi:hypothetical protein